MRTRDATIPIGLWICAALCAHFLFGTGGLVVAQVHEDRSELWKLSRQASNLAQRGEQTFEISLNEPGEQAPEEPPPPPPPPPKPPEPPKPPPKAKTVEEKKAEEKKKEEEKKKQLAIVEKKPEKAPPPCRRCRRTSASP